MSDEVARRLAEETYGQNYSVISAYVDILLSRGMEWGLLGPREGERIWERHILNSAAVGQLVPEESLVIDVGSGAGLPGVPLAILRPDLRVTLLEPLLRRANFLQGVVDELELGDRVRVIRGRAEDHDEVYDVVTCRAVANLRKLLGWTTPLFLGSDDHRGCLVALKGESAQDEVDDAEDVLKRRRLRAEVHRIAAHEKADPTFAVRVSSAA